MTKYSPLSPKQAWDRVAHGRAVGAVVAQLLYTKTGVSWTHWPPSGFTWTDGLIPSFYSPLYVDSIAPKGTQFFSPGVTIGGDDFSGQAAKTPFILAFFGLRHL
jgi:hypothetical protein